VEIAKVTEGQKSNKCCSTSKFFSAWFSFRY